MVVLIAIADVADDGDVMTNWGYKRMSNVFVGIEWHKGMFSR